MPRPTKDGMPAREARHRKLTELYVKKVKREKTAFNTWDTHQRGLVLRVQPSGHRAFKVVYRRHGRPCWFHIGDGNAIGLGAARKIAGEVMVDAANGKDPAAERKAMRGAGTFAELHEKYLEQHAKKKNKSWRQADALVRRYLLSRWGKLPVKDVTRGDVKALVGRIDAPILANQVLAAASAVFSWAEKQEIVERNPVHGVDRNETRSRERVLSDSEIPPFWSAMDGVDPVRAAALKAVLLLGQRPGEVSHMRIEHLKDGWWEMPGEPVSKLGWPGLKNKQSHRIWIPAAARAIVDEQIAGRTAGFVFTGRHISQPISRLDDTMRDICATLQVDRATPHDFRRTFSTKVTALGFGKDAMNRVTNHKEGGIASVYDRHEYAEENKRIMEAIAAHIMAMVDGRAGDASVVEFRR
jgi:integrase